jgi:hypothetical protein
MIPIDLSQLRLSVLGQNSQDQSGAANKIDMIDTDLKKENEHEAK